MPLLSQLGTGGLNAFHLVHGTTQSRPRRLQLDGIRLQLRLRMGNFSIGAFEFGRNLFCLDALGRQPGSRFTISALLLGETALQGIAILF